MMMLWHLFEISLEGLEIRSQASLKKSSPFAKSRIIVLLWKFQTFQSFKTKLGNKNQSLTKHNVFFCLFRYIRWPNLATGSLTKHDVCLMHVLIV